MPYKLPWLKFVPAKWIEDTRILSHDARSAWIDIICLLWESRGKVELTLEAYARHCGFEVPEMAIILTEIIDTKVAKSPHYKKDDLKTFDGKDKIFIQSRRIFREEIKRKGERLRQRKSRSYEDVTLLSQGEYRGESIEGRGKSIELRNTNTIRGSNSVPTHDPKKEVREYLLTEPVIRPIFQAYKLNLETFTPYLDKYLERQAAEGRLGGRPLSDYRRHLSSWIQIQIEKKPPKKPLIL